MSFNLSNNVGLITGAAGLLGQEHAIALLESDASVVITDVSSQALKLTKDKLKSIFPNSDVLVFELDVTDESSVFNVIDKLRKQSVFVDVLINNAALDPKVNANSSTINSSRLENFSVDQWNKEISVGLTGTMICSKIFGYEMAKKGKGVILNIASDLSVISPDQRLYHEIGKNENEQSVKPITYSAIKSGIIGITKYLATYWASSGVRCNALSPGGVFNGQNKEFVNRLTSLIPVGRMAESTEYRGAVQFLCSDASKYMNGQNIVMDGGRSVW